MVSTRMLVKVEKTSTFHGHAGTNVSVGRLNVTVETQFCPILTSVLTSTAVVMNHAVSSMNELINMEKHGVMEQDVRREFYST